MTQVTMKEQFELPFEKPQQLWSVVPATITLSVISTLQLSHFIFGPWIWVQEPLLRFLRTKAGSNKSRMGSGAIGGFGGTSFRQSGFEKSRAYSVKIRPERPGNRSLILSISSMLKF